ncbi:2-hydroxyacid dehydrogenase [Siccirubricoccus phaeus]|uniref:2-hydroxyacid dehydrogenase n=1 Tax=Siccirubricoccus phaeus TaxID=2595053 RepID=UPI0011F0CDC6|nr:glyoxylate/hydroxypyruvate reductase A [Siccirubricoccus phaeus]
MVAVAFFSEVDDPEDWRRALGAVLPEAEFRVAPALGDPAEIEAAMVWKPPAGFFAPMRKLKLVVNLGAGVDSLVGRDDLPPVPIARLNDPGMVQLMTSYVVFAVTRYARDIHHFERAQRRGAWEYRHPRALDRIRVGVLGLGELGGPAAQALAGMGYSVTGWSRSPKSIPGVRWEGSLDAVLAESEILVALVPLTPDTRGLIGAREFGLLPRGAKLVNACRGPVVDEAALLVALSDGTLEAATLDVFNQEPLPEGHPLWRMENVLITPHLASITVPDSAARDVAESIRRVLRGEPPLHQVDPGRGY